MKVGLGERLRIRQLIGLLSGIDAKWFRLIRGLIIFIITILLLTYTTLYIVENKIEMHFMLRGFENISLKAPTFDIVLSSMIFKACLALFIVLMVASLMAFLRGFEWRVIGLLTLIFHSFLIVIVFTLLQVPFMMSVPKASFAIVDAGMQNVTFYNASMSGITPEGLVTITSGIIKAGYVEAFRMYPNMTIPNWNLLDGKGLDEALKGTTTYMNISNVRYVYRDSEIYLDKLDLSSGNWSRLEYETLLYRSSVRLTPMVALEEYMLSIFSMLSTIGIVIYNTIGFKRLYGTSTKYAVVTGIVMYILFFLLGGL